MDKLFEPLSTLHMGDWVKSENRYSIMRKVLIRCAKQLKNVRYMVHLCFGDMPETDEECTMEKKLYSFHESTEFTVDEKWNLVRLAFASRHITPELCNEVLEKTTKLDPE